MSNHQYAIKYRGKTLGVKDCEQLFRLLETDKIQLDHKVFILDQKRWCTLADLDEYKNREENLVEEPEVEHIEQAEEFTNLISELETTEKSDSSRDFNDSEISLSNTRTIRKVTGLEAKKKSKKKMETLVAAKVPNPEKNWRSGFAAVATATLVLLFGLAIGFAGTTLFVNDAQSEQSGKVLLQAQNK